MEKIEVPRRVLEIIGEDVEYNTKCPCIQECGCHGFCSLCMIHHDKNSSHPPLCMRNQELKNEQREVNWHPKDKNTRYYGDRD